MTAIGTVTRKVHAESPKQGVNVWVRGHYLGAGVRREERYTEEHSNDWYSHPATRTSEDNGATWSSWETHHKENPMQAGFSLEISALATEWDPVSARTVRMMMRRITRGRGDEALQALFSGNEVRFCDHTFWLCSADEGRTWSEPEMFRYEAGPDFDADHWGDPEFFASNGMYGGYNCVPLRNETLAYAAVVPVRYVDPEDEPFISVGFHQPKPDYVNGVAVMVGRWDAARATYQWSSSDPLFLPRRISSRGLLEPALAELSTGAVMLSMRGSNSTITPGRAWCSVSEDGGLTWGAVRDLRYDDGSSFYSPSAYSKMIRSGKTGRLYWIGNICDKPPGGNGPRHPLVIAEIDEAKVALKRDTVTVIDAPDPIHDSAQIQFSNFQVLENRETLDFEFYMTRLDPGAQRERGSDAYFYTLTLDA